MEKESAGDGMKRAFFVGSAIIGACFLLSTTSIAQYRPVPFMGGGYSDKKMSENRWKVSGFAVEQPKEYAVQLALYRAAILLRRAGFTHFEIVDSYISGSSSIYAHNELADFTVVGTNTPEVPVPCEAKKKWVANCRLMAVEDVLVSTAPILGRNVEEDLAADPSGKAKQR